MYYNLSDEELARVRPDQMQRYLEATGWMNVNIVPGKFVVYHLPAERSSEVVVPTEPSFRDYTRRVAEAIHDLADVQSRSVYSVLGDILFVAMDHLMFHLDGPSIRDHRISLEEGVNIYQSTFSSLRAAAHDQIEPKFFHPRLGRAEANRYLKACQTGAATPGSYIANIFCPADLEAVEQPLIPLPDLDRNFARQVTSRALRSIARATQAIKRDDVDSLVHPQNREDIISSNFFEALSSMRLKDTLTEMIISVEWTPTIRPPVDVPNHIILQAENFPIFSEVASRLRPTTSPKTEQITGRVAVLSGEEGEASLMQGEVLIDGETLDGRIVRVRVDLSEKDYERACDAHKQNRQVRIAGVLQIGKRLHQLNKPFGFTVGDVISKFNRDSLSTIEMSEA